MYEDDRPDVGLGIKVSQGFASSLAQLSIETGDSEADLLLKSVALLVIALRAKKQGKRLVIAGNQTTEDVTGL